MADCISPFDERQSDRGGAPESSRLSGVRWVTLQGGLYEAIAPNDASLTPNRRQTSATAVPLSVRRTAYATGSPTNRAFVVVLRFWVRHPRANLLDSPADVEFEGRVNFRDDNR